MTPLKVLAILLGCSHTVSALKIEDANASPKYNVLFIVADQLRFDVPKAIAPNLHALAAEGLQMESAYTSTPTCEPARAAILTGRSPWNHGMLGKGHIPFAYPVELPRTFTNGGYRTASIGKNHYGWNFTSDSGVGHGFQSTQICDGKEHFDEGHFIDEVDDFDKWFAKKLPGKDSIPEAEESARYDRYNGWRAKAWSYNESLHPTAWTGAKAVEFIEEQPRGNEGGQDKPWMLKVSFHRPHSPYDPPQRVLDTVTAEDLPAQHLCKGAQGKNESGGGAWCLRYRGYEGDPEGCGPSLANAWCGKMPDDEVTHTRRAYFASVRFVDEWIGKILQALKRRNLVENTWIMFTADHGDQLGDHYLWRKGQAFEGASHIPMMLRWPHQWAARQPVGSVVPRGTVIKAPIVAELRDVLHTLVDAAGLSNNASLMPPRGSSPHSWIARDGKSLLCLLKDPTGKKSCEYPPNPGPWRKWLDMEHNHLYNSTNHWSGLTDGSMKYVFRSYFPDELLFNLTEDPFEEEDVSKKPQYAEELKKWRARLVEQFEQEGRGHDFVKHGQLTQQQGNFPCSSNFPTWTLPKIYLEAWALADSIDMDFDEMEAKDSGWFEEAPAKHQRPTSPHQPQRFLGVSLAKGTSQDITLTCGALGMRS